MSARVPAILVMMASGGVASIAQFGTATAADVAECPGPPNGVVRFALASGGKEADLYEWVDRTFRKVGTSPVGKQLTERFLPGSFYQWNSWGSDVSHISRESLGSGKKLSTPYALSRDATWLAAGAVTMNEKDSAPSHLVFMQVGSAAATTDIEFKSPIHAIAWSPTSEAVVVLRREESYGKDTLRQRFAAAIGHPIPYAKVTLSIVGRDGSVRCSIVPAENLSYGSGYVRWDPY